MKKFLIVLAAISILAVLIAARPPDFCEGKPDHPHCQAPSPTVSPTPTPTTSPWTLIFDDQFNIDVPPGSFPSAVSDRWAAYPSPWTSLGGYYYPEKVNFISGGTLKWWLHQENGQWLMSAPQPILPNGTKYQTYGRYELLWRTDSLPGYYGVPLLWPQGEDYLQHGEIDWPEGNLTGNIHGFIHYTDASSGSEQKACTTRVAFASGWHTTVTEWTPGRVRLFLDGTLICESTERVPSTPMRWVLQVTVSPQGLPPDGTSGYFEADRVRIWSYIP